MTDENVLSVSEDLPPDLISAGIQEMLSQARNLGLTWTLRLATVQKATPLAIIFDGDTNLSNAVSMVGTLFLAQRVYVIIIPPSGNFVVGFATYPIVPGRLIAAAYDSANSAVVGAEAVMLTAPTATYRPGITYRFEVAGSIFNGGGVGIYTLRRNDLAGTSFWSGFAMQNSASFGFPGEVFGYFANNGTGNVETAIALTLTPIGSNIQMFGLGAGRNMIVTEAATNKQIVAVQI